MTEKKQTKMKYVTFTIQEKKEIIDYHNNNPEKSMESIIEWITQTYKKTTQKKTLKRILFYLFSFCVLLLL